MGDDNVTPIDRRTKLVRQVREQMQEESGEEDRYEKQYEGDNPRYDPRPSRDSLENHTKRHTSDTARIGRELAVLRARQLGEVEEILREQFIEPLVDASFIAASLARDALTSGRVRPRDMRDVAAALDLWARFRPMRTSEGVPVEQHKAELATVIESARRNMTDEEYDRFVADLRAQGREPRPEGTGDPAG